MSTQPALGDAATAPSPAHYTPEQTMVLFLDFHGFFVQSLGEAGAHAKEQAAALASWARTIPGLHIGHVLIGKAGTPFPTCKSPDTWKAVVSMLAADSTTYSEPAEIKAENDSEPLFTRETGYVSALSCAGLERHFETHDIKHLVLCGLTTSRCVMFTALAATEKQFVVTVVEDACADRSKEIHGSAKEVMDTRCWIVSVEQVTSQLFKR